MKYGKNYCSAEQEAMPIYGLLFISCLRVQVVKSRFASLCLAFEVRVENYTFRMEGFIFFILSHSVTVKVNSNDKRSQGASHSCHNTAVGFADLKLSRWWHNLGSESNYFQQSGSHPGYRGRETCCILTFPRLGAPGSELGCKKIWTEKLHKQSPEWIRMEAISHLASAKLYVKFLGIYYFKNRRTFTYRCRGINFRPV